MILGGIEIPFYKGRPLGHSDGDALCLDALVHWLAMRPAYALSFFRPLLFSAVPNRTPFTAASFPSDYEVSTRGGLDAKNRHLADVAQGVQCGNPSTWAEAVRVALLAKNSNLR